MSTGNLILLTLQSLAFAVWAFASFRALFGGRRLAVEATGSFNPGPFSFVSGLRRWLQSEAGRSTARLWLVSFGVLVVCSILMAVRAGA